MSKAKTLTEEEREMSGGTLVAILLIIGSVWSGFKWFNADMEAVNALFSGLAFATLIFTVFLQRRELQLQRQELAETRRELERSASAQEASERALKAQADATAMSAQLNAINYLLGYYREEIKRGMQVGMQLTDQNEYRRLRSNEGHLVQMLEATYQNLAQQRASQSQTISGTPTQHPTPEN